MNIKSTPVTSSGSVVYLKENCTNEAGVSPNLVVNSLSIDLTASDIKIVPGVSLDTQNPLLPIGKMAKTDSSKKLIAGINGGYFWRTDITPLWLDDVCRGKTRKQAETAANSENANYGIHDGAIIIDGATVGSNCDCWGYSRPAVVQTTGGNSDWSISVLSRGEQPKGAAAALGAGPNLVSFDGIKSFIDIPSDDDNINIHEHAANTAIGLLIDSATGKAVKAIMVTTDGSDECGRLDSSCGINAPNFASLLLNHFKTTVAMSMDQGGSTTMWIDGADSTNGDGVVSYAGGGARAVANGLFIQLV